MERITKTEQESIKKMSTERLREHLLKEDYAESQLAKMSRDDMMETYAEILARRKEPAAEAAAAVKLDPALERERMAIRKAELELETKKLEAEERRWAEQREEQAKQREDQGKQREIEEKRLQEQREIEEKRLREQREHEERMLRIKLEMEERQRSAQAESEARALRIKVEEKEKQRELERQKMDANTARIKRYGDAFRNAITPQTNDPTDTIAFFRNAEALFKTLDCGGLSRHKTFSIPRSRTLPNLG